MWFSDVKCLGAFGYFQSAPNTVRSAAVAKSRGLSCFREGVYQVWHREGACQERQFSNKGLWLSELNGTITAGPNHQEFVRSSASGWGKQYRQQLTYATGKLEQWCARARCFHRKERCSWTLSASDNTASYKSCSTRLHHRQRTGEQFRRGPSHPGAHLTLLPRGAHPRSFRSTVKGNLGMNN